MKKFILFFFLLAAAIFLISGNNLLTFSYCDQPILYRVDTVDPKFNLSRGEFVEASKKATQIWENHIGKNLFEYDPKGDLSINLIYDERQSLNTRIDELADKVKSDQELLKPQIGQYEIQASDFKRKLRDLNSEIEFWNNQGGAPRDKYENLIQRQKELQSEAEKLNTLAQSLNRSNEQFNAQVDQLNNTIETFNDAIELRPEEGLYKGAENRIEIYFNNNEDELVHTLAHELGHALDIGHLSNRQAIMFSKTTQTITLAKEDIKALEEVCRRRSIVEILKRYFLQIRQKVLQ